MFLGVVWSYYPGMISFMEGMSSQDSLSVSMSFVLQGLQSQALDLVRLANAFKEKAIPLPTSLWHPFSLHLRPLKKFSCYFLDDLERCLSKDVHSNTEETASLPICVLLMWRGCVTLDKSPIFPA